MQRNSEHILHSTLIVHNVWNTSRKLHNKCRDICTIYLFGVLRRFQHCTGHITTGSWKGRGNQYIQFVRVLYCKLPTNGKQLPAFPLEPVRGSNPGLRGGRRECYHSATMAPIYVLEGVQRQGEMDTWGVSFINIYYPDTRVLFLEPYKDMQIPWSLFRAI